MARFKGAQQGIAVLACSAIMACAIDSRVGKLDMPSTDGDEPDDPAAVSGNAGNSAGASGSALPGEGLGPTAPGSDGPETGIAPSLPASGGAGGSGSGASATEPGSAEPGAPQPGSPQSGEPGAPQPGAAGQGGGGEPSSAPPPPVTEPEVVGGCSSQLLRNGDFERGADGWSQQSELRDLIVWSGHPELAATGVTAQAGNYLGWIGGVPSGEFVMYRTRLTQEVAIPAEAVSLTFSGYVWASQPEPGLPNPDWAILELADPTPGSTFLWRVQYFEDSETGGWVRFEETSTDVARFAGKTVPVQVHNMPNANGLLSVWLDSLRLEARCAR